MAQITKESMQEQRAAEAWFYIQSLIPKEIKLISYDPTCRNKCQMGHLKWLISYGSYGMVRIVHIKWVYAEPEKHQEKLRGFKKKRDLFLKPLKGEFIVCSQHHCFYGMNM